MILQTFNQVFRNDVSAIYSQTLVRLVARMIKERKFQVHPNVLSCLLHLRLRGELDAMRRGRGSKTKGQDHEHTKGKGIFKSDIRKKWQTKNQKKREKEMKEVQKEMAEAEAEVDTEERAQIVSPMILGKSVTHQAVAANRDLEKSLRPLLFDPQASYALPTPSRRTRGNISIRPSHQPGFLRRPFGNTSTDNN